MNQLNQEKNNTYNIDNINNIKNIKNIKEQEKTTNVVIFQHSIKDSTIPLDNNFQNQDMKPDEESGTILTQIGFMKEKSEKNGTIYELNKSLEKADNNSKNNSSLKEEPKEVQSQNESFLQKTKRWAGNVWSYINIANYFPKTEYKEYRNANGDWVKIPVKKIPLKKKTIKETDEEHIINKSVDRNQTQLAYVTNDRIPIPNFY